MFPRLRRPAAAACAAWPERARTTACASRKASLSVRVGQTEWVQLRARLLREIKADEDSLRFYHLDETAKQKIEHHGVDKPLDLTEPLIL